MNLAQKAPFRMILKSGMITFQGASVGAYARICFMANRQDHLFSEVCSGKKHMDSEGEGESRSIELQRTLDLKLEQLSCAEMFLEDYGADVARCERGSDQRGVGSSGSGARHW